MEELSICLSRWMTERRGGGGNSAFIAAMLERAPISQAGMDVVMRGREIQPGVLGRAKSWAGKQAAPSRMTLNRDGIEAIA